MTYTKSQLEALNQWLEKTLKLFDDSYFYWMPAKPQRAKDFRASLVEDLATYRKALAEAGEEPSPYAPSEAYLNALRSFGFTDEDCAKEIQNARDCDFDLLLADEKRKAYDQGRADGQVIGFAEGWDEGYDVCANDHDLVLNTGRTMRGSDEYEEALARVNAVRPLKGKE